MDECDGHWEKHFVHTWTIDARIATEDNPLSWKTLLSTRTRCESAENVTDRSDLHSKKQWFLITMTDAGI
jgi:hypothetical protein